MRASLAQVQLRRGQRTLQRQGKCPPAPAQTLRRSIRQTENISPGDRKRAPASKPISGDSSCKIVKRERRAISQRNLIDRSEVLTGSQIRVQSRLPRRIMAKRRFISRRWFANCKNHYRFGKYFTPMI